MELSNDIEKKEGICEVVGRAGPGYDGVERERVYEAVAQAGERKCEAAVGAEVALAPVLDCISSS